MLRRINERVHSEEKGFTLIELLVVILIIGILAAIAIPAFLGQRTKAQDTQAKTSTRTAATAAETFYTDNQSFSIPTAMDAPGLLAIEPSLSDVPVSGGFTAKANTADKYTVTVKSKTNTYFTIQKTMTGAGSGVAARTCGSSIDPTTNASTTPVSSGGCNNGTW